MHIIGLIILGLILYLIFRRPYGMHKAGCCGTVHGHGMGTHYGNQGGSEPNNARAILDERYVKGEISDDEYKTKKANLM
jgi:uncharacterized membrane protein